jgi:hypothetical protein
MKSYELEDQLALNSVLMMTKLKLSYETMTQIFIINLIM